MTLTLYKNCILSNSYSEVFHNEIFENYLATLSNISFELDTIYQTNSGVFIIDFDDTYNYSVYEYNYLKVQEGNFIRYCFIDRIEIGNEVARIYYSEDIFQSYSSTMHIRDSWLSRSKRLSYSSGSTTKNITLYNIPIEYNGNDRLVDITNIEESTYGEFTDNLVSIILQIQVYNSSSYGESTERFCKTVAIYGERDITEYDYERLFNIYIAKTIGEGITKNQSKTFKYINSSNYSDTGSDFYFQIDNITIIPYKLISNSLFPIGENAVNNISPNFRIIGKLNIPQEIGSTNNFNVFLVELNNLNKSQKYYKKLYSFNYELINNFKNFSIGTYTGQYGMINNGKDKYIRFSNYISDYNFDIFLEYDNNFIKITNDFVLDIPFESLLGEEQSSRKLNRILQNVNGVATITSGAINIGVDIATGGASSSLNAMSGLTKTGKISKSKYNTSKREYNQNIIDANTVGGIAGGVGQMVNGITNIISTNQPNYTSTKGTFSSSDALLNANYGLVLKRINASNTNEVQEMIDNTGYITYYIANDEVLSRYTGENVLKFDFVKLYGSFSQEIAEQLKDILLNGYKIHYSL